ncbi:MAG: T9SS type A sorting domain-containing protein [Ignavibacteriaceae bacterium]|nr:T9SS type A sorting domain-containing protein [Ignavibacteriaceae bacterium]
MKIKLIPILFLLITTSIYPQWFRQTNGLEASWTIGTAIDACDKDHAFIVATHSIFCITTNGGAQWTQIIWPFPGESGENPQKLFKTLDGGATWLQTNFTGYTQLVKFFDANFGFVFDQEVFQVTYNGGVDWQSVSFKHAWSNDLEQVPGDENKIWFTDSANLFLSKNTGVSFELFPVAGFAKARDIVFTDKDNGWVLCDGGKLFKIENASVITSIAAEEKIPENFLLYQNYPNPFNPTTNIEYDLPNSSQVSLKIYNIIGEEIRKLVDEYQSLGKQKVTFEARGLPSGVYIYRLTAGDKIYSRKMIYTK